MAAAASLGPSPGRTDVPELEVRTCAGDRRDRQVNGRPALLLGGSGADDRFQVGVACTGCTAGVEWFGPEGGIPSTGTAAPRGPAPAPPSRAVPIPGPPTAGTSP